jgi:hypothetical protein
LPHNARAIPERAVSARLFKTSFPPIFLKVAAWNHRLVLTHHRVR